MNDARRKLLRQLATDLQVIASTLDGLKDEEQEYYDNMPESFQNGDKGEKAQAAIDALQEAWDSIDSAATQIEDTCNA